MIRRPPRSTRTDTLFPYTTLVRSGVGKGMAVFSRQVDGRHLATGLQDAENLWLLTPRILRPGTARSEEHTSELQSLMRNSYAVFCLTKTHSTHITQQAVAQYSHPTRRPTPQYLIYFMHNTHH